MLFWDKSKPTMLTLRFCGTTGVNILKDIKGIEILDISKNNNYDTAPYIYPDKEFQYLTQLRSLYIDLHSIPVFGKGFKHLKDSAEQMSSLILCN
jgi:hypothetical protein